MIFRYGNYSHALNEAGLQVERRGVFSSQGLETQTSETWTISGQLLAANQRALIAAVQEMVVAYGKNFQDAGLFLDDGRTPAVHQVANSQTIGGVRVTRKPSFPEFQGGELGTFYSYAVELQFDRLPASGLSTVVEWEETINISGGAPRWIFLPTLNGPPQRQQVQQSTPYHMTQSGRAVGWQNWPTAPGPIAPQNEHQEMRHITRKTPRRVGTGASLTDVEWEITWSYEFESATPLNGTPTSRQP